MTALQSIIKEAQAIRRKSPKMEWKKAVAQASAIYASKHKGKSPVGKKRVIKKKAIKKTATKKAVGKYVKTVRKGKITDVIYKRKKIGAVKKSATTMHKDTKSHNVNIRVMSGVSAINKHALHELKENLWKNGELKKVIPELQYLIKNPPANFTKNDINLCKKEIRQAKMYIKENNIHIKELKKLI